jgi:DNA-binding transcriptional LysR family regulator
MPQPPRDLTIKQIRYFISAADNGSMSAAAKSLGIAQSAVSSAIAELERTFGVQLLVRHRRGLSSTAEGRVLLDRARDLLLQVDDLLNEAVDLGKSPSGTVQLGCFRTLSPFFVPFFVERVAARYPNLRVEIIEGNLDDLQAQLLQGVLGAAVLYDIELDSRLEADLLSVAPPHVVLPTTHALAAQETVSLRSLTDEPFILLDLPYSRDYFERLFVNAGSRPRIVHRSANYETVRALVAAGHGFTVLNQRPRVDRTYDGKRLVVRPLSDRVPPLRVVFARVSGSRATRRDNAVREICEEWSG